MKLEILGSGGAAATPKPFCGCEACREAREKGAPYTRLGPSVFLHGPDILFDTPEEIGVELNRSKVSRIGACFYSHWHPDHTAGKRVFEMNMDWLSLHPENKRTDVYVTEKINETFQWAGAINDQFEYWTRLDVVRKHVIGNAEIVRLNGYSITPIQMAMDYVFAYIVSGRGKNILIVMDELKNWLPDAAVREIPFDLVLLPFGIFDVNPFDGKRLIDSRHPVFASEQTIGETLAVVRQLTAKKTVLSHIEEPDGITLDLARKLGVCYSDSTGRDIVLAYDTMVIDI